MSDPTVGHDSDQPVDHGSRSAPSNAGEPAAAQPDPAVAEPSARTEAGSGDTPASSNAAVAADPPPARRRFGRRRPVATTGTRRRRAARFELPILIVVAVAIAIVLKTFVVQPFYIPSQSMEQTLYGCPGCSGDRILVFKPVFKVRDPHPGDVIVFKAPDRWDEAGRVTLSSNPLVHGVQWFGQLVGVVPPSEMDLVKRVIAVGGQTVKCCDDNGNVQISDHGAAGPWRSLNEPYIFENSAWTKPTTPGVKSPEDTRSFGPVTVPKGRLWVLGDHRGDSQDSRYHCGDGGSGANCDPDSSTVPVSDVIGKAVVIAWPPSRWRTLGTPKTFTSAGVPQLRVPGVGGLPVEPATVGLAGVLAVGGWGRRRRR